MQTSFQTLSTAFFFGALTAVAPLAAAAQDLTEVSAGVRAGGTVLWELDTITHYGFDEVEGIDLDVQEYAGSQASQVAFLAGELDVIVADWLWVARQRASGLDVVFLPYSKAVGGMLVSQDSTAQTLEDLAGGSIAIAGGPLDKSWLILRAYAEQEYGIDLQTETEQVFGAPPLIAQVAMSGEADGGINFWHWTAKMEAGGMRTLISTGEAAQALGLDPETPLLGYVFHGDVDPDLLQSFAAASRSAKSLLSEDAAAWDRLRPVMNAADDAQFDALREGFIAGIPSQEPVDEEAANRMLQLMATIGGDELVGPATSLPPGVFVGSGG